MTKNKKKLLRPKLKKYILTQIKNKQNILLKTKLKKKNLLQSNQN